MELGPKEFVAAVGFTLAACDSQEMPETGATDEIGDVRAGFSRRFPAKTGKVLPTEEDFMRGQLTGDCTAPDHPLMGEQFPMRRGNELLHTFPDGTCLERLEDKYHHDAVVYAVSGDRKIKFSDLTGDQQRRLLGAQSFEELEALSIAFIEELEKQATGLSLSFPEKTPRVMFEGPIEACPQYRYRRGMLSGKIRSVGIECIWDERQIYCPAVIASRDSSTTEWTAFLKDGSYVLFDDTSDWRDSQYLDAVTRPTPQQWLGTQPDCPTAGSVINIDFSEY